MYVTDYTRKPRRLSRDQCVSLIFEVGGLEGYGYSLSALVSAVYIADRWAEWAGTDQTYSQELAHVALVVGTKLEEDYVYKITQAAEETANHLVYSMEWELVELLGYARPSIPLFKIIDLPRSSYLSGNPIPTLAPVFEVLLEQICLDPSLLQIHPGALWLGIKLLFQRKRLQACRQARHRIFERLLIQLAREYEVRLDQVITAYLKFKRSETQGGIIRAGPSQLQPL